MTNITVPTIFVAGISKLLENKNLPTIMKKLHLLLQGLGLEYPLHQKFQE